MTVGKFLKIITFSQNHRNFSSRNYCRFSVYFVEFHLLDHLSWKFVDMSNNRSRVYFHCACVPRRDRLIRRSAHQRDQSSETWATWSRRFSKTRADCLFSFFKTMLTGWNRQSQKMGPCHSKCANLYIIRSNYVLLHSMKVWVVMTTQDFNGQQLLSMKTSHSDQISQLKRHVASIAPGLTRQLGCRRMTAKLRQVKKYNKQILSIKS